MKHMVMTIALLGIGATATMDACALALARLGVMPAPDYRMVGRWIGHMAHGRFRHDSIGKAQPVPAEVALGWAVHYTVGIAFAGVLLGLVGLQWLQTPTAGPALLVGLATVAAPFLVMQPAMGLGLAASRTPKPSAARLRSTANHLLFGIGLYVAGKVLSLGS